ncbi:unnamed protein product [Rotaria sordida]|uniref:DRBM domain-containing protein n=1 Tax=Rotaria sordida TaxID=392033 RepID=A0A813VGL0_9BILA|nr:unnamed protein product [Rotaria sordida]
MQQPSPIKLIYDLARRNKIFIKYRLEKESGPAHAKMYTIRLYVGDKDYVSAERSIKLAQRAAAQLALDDLRNLLITNNYDQDISQINVFQSPTVALNTWANRNHISTHYVLLNERLKSTSSNYSRSLFYYRLYLGHDLYFDGHAYTHQQARTNCALNALYFLRQNPISTQQLNILSSSSSSSSISKNNHQTKSDISLMYERAKQLGLSVHRKFDDPFTVTYQIGENYSTTGNGYNKQSAKQLAAKKMLEILPLNHIQENFNPITRIYQLAQQRQVKIEFIQLFNKENFTFQIKFGNNDIAEGYGKTKKLAKQIAAKILLEKLDSIIILPPPPIKGLLKRDGNNDNINKQEKKHVHFVEEIIEKDERRSCKSSSSSSSTISKSYKQQLIEACEKLNIHVEYLDKMNENENAGSSRYQSIVSLSTDDRLLAQFRGHGPSLIRAQENASSAIWNNLKQLFNGSIQVPKSKRNEKNYRQISVE